MRISLQSFPALKIRMQLVFTYRKSAWLSNWRYRLYRRVLCYMQIMWCNDFKEKLFFLFIAFKIKDFFETYNSMARENNVTYPRPHFVIDAVKSKSTNFTWKTFTGSDVSFFDESFKADSENIYLSFNKKFQITGEWLLSGYSDAGDISWILVTEFWSCWPKRHKPSVKL